MDQRVTPIYNKMVQFAQRDPARFHVPGHKGEGYEAWTELDSIFQYDVTELDGLDDLGDPHGIIMDAQQLAAQLYEAKETCFLIGGSTAGNLAAVLSVCSPGDILIVERTVHKSVIHALTLAQAKAVFVQPEVDKETGIATGASVAALRDALEQYPQAKAVLITRPNYYGMAKPLEQLVKTVHSFNLPLIVDEAHGAHLGFHPSLPQSALSAGADIVIQSTHKMLTSLTMTGMLHIQGERIQSDLVKKRLAQIQSSSPSYILLASIDLARRTLALDGPRLIGQFIDNYYIWMQTLKQLTPFEWIGASEQNQHEQDPFKLLMCDRTATLNGFQLLEQLRIRNCWAEMADPTYCLLAFSFRTKAEDLERLTAALQDIASEYHLFQKHRKSHQAHINHSIHLSKPVDFSYQTMRETELISLQDAEGRYAAEMVIPYPPGIPLLFPGEEVTVNTLETLYTWQQTGARFQHRKHVDRVRVYK